MCIARIGYSAESRCCASIRCSCSNNCAPMASLSASVSESGVAGEQEVLVASWLLGKERGASSQEQAARSKQPGASSTPHAACSTQQAAKLLPRESAWPSHSSKQQGASSKEQAASSKQQRSHLQWPSPFQSAPPAPGRNRRPTVPRRCFKNKTAPVSAHF